MVKSLYLSNLFVRFGLAIVFLWFGIDKFFHPIYWLNAWVPKWFVQLVGNIGLNGVNLVYLIGVFEVVVGISLISGVFIKPLSFLGVIFLVSILIFTGIDEVTVRDIGLIGGFLSLIVWPTKNRRVY